LHKFLELAQALARTVGQPLDNLGQEEEQNDSTLGSVFWIDALCIDQNNTKEKNHQVKQMGKIYANAYRVVSWLGWWDHSLGSSTMRDRPLWRNPYLTIRPDEDRNHELIHWRTIVGSYWE